MCLKKYSAFVHEGRVGSEERKGDYWPCVDIVLFAVAGVGREKVKEKLKR